MYITPASAAFIPTPMIAWLDARSETVPMLDSFEILYVDGQWLSEISKLKRLDVISGINQALLSGKPVAVFGGDVELSDMVNNIFVKEKMNLPMLAHALKVYPDIKVKNRLGSDQLFIAGFNVTQDEVESRVYEWASCRTSNRARSTLESLPARSTSSATSEDPVIYGLSSATGGDPYWGLVAAHTFLIYMNPYGRLNVTNCWYYLYNDKSNTYDWFNLVTEITSEPGIAVYRSNWRTADLWNYLDADYYGDPNMLIDHGPPDTSGVSSVTYEFGVVAGEKGSRVTSKMSVTYNVLDVQVDNQSDSAAQLARWWHNVPESGTNGMNKYTIKPGATVRVLPSTATRLYNWYKVQYGQPVLWWWEWWSREFSVETTIDYPRYVNTLIVKAGDSPSSWIGNVDNVKSGVLSAVDDANSRTWLKLDEQINVYEVTSTQGLLNLVRNPPLRAVFINAHGETIPLPNMFLGPYIKITWPSDGQVIYSSPTVYAEVSPPPGYTLGGQWPPFPLIWWYRPSTGQWSATLQMYKYSGDTYYRTLSLPAYDTYRIFVGAMSTNLLASVAHITVHYNAPPPPGGGGCPYISTWNGTQYVMDNNLLAASEHSKGTDIVDYYKLQQPLVPNSDGTYSLMLSEFEKEHNFIDQVRLLAIDHPSNVSVAVSPYGEILTYTNPKPPVSAITNEKENVKKLLSSVDGKYYEGYNGSYIILNFGEEVDVSKGAKLVLVADDIYKMSIHIQVQDAKGSWNTVACFIPRRYWATEIIDMSKHLPDARGNLKVRLYFTANHKIDFVGLDTSPQATIDVNQANLISAVHSAGIKATYQDMLDSGNIYAELTPGFDVKMNFTAPQKKDANQTRSFIFAIEGHYKRAGSPIALTVNWKDWFDLLEDRARNYGWIWANVAGYSFYYFGNSWYDSKVPSPHRQIPGEAGLKQFLSRDVAAKYYDGHKAQRDADFIEKSGFDPQFYNDLPTGQIGASRPLATKNLIWNTVGMVDVSTTDYVVASVTMNKSMPGVFIHSGLAPDVDLNGSPNQYRDDFLKGYIAAMLAVEEARAYLTHPKTLAQTFGNKHAAAFSVTMIPGGWGTGEGTFDGVSRLYRYVDLVLTMPSHYKDYIYTYTSPYPPYPTYTYIHELSVADFKLTSTDTEIWAKIDLTESGWETGHPTTELMDDLGWWQIGLSTDILGNFIGIPYLGSAIGLIPILIRGPSPPAKNPFDRADRGVWANGTALDPNNDEWGTVSIYFRVMFLRSEVPRDYTLTLGMASWIGLTIPEAFYHNPRYKGLPSDITLRFKVTG